MIDYDLHFHAIETVLDTKNKQLALVLEKLREILKDMESVEDPVQVGTWEAHRKLLILCGMLEAKIT